MSINADKFSKLIKAQIKNYQEKPLYSETGRVINVGDGIAQVSGLNNLMFNEVVIFENGSKGIAFNLESNFCGIVLLGEFSDIKEGSLVKRTKEIISVPVGDGLLSRVVNALGEPIDGLGKIQYTKTAPVEKIAPGVMQRKSVDQPLETGILAIDSMFCIGKGQRELIIGDKQTGKSTIALDTIINQKNKNVYCVYVFVGQKNSTIVQFIKTLKEQNVMDYCTFVVANASELPALKYLAPFAGITIAEEWMSQGKDVLIIYDDLTKHAESYRTLSLLLRRPVGREAYPGDVFYLHSRLLERSGRLNEKYGGGSITALPIIETQAGDISAYIPTNVISITDGQLFMVPSLFNQGQRPAIDVGLSVSRIGSTAQYKALKKVAASLKLELSQYNELVSFARFGSDLDNETKQILEHGDKITAFLKQRNESPLPLSVQVLYLLAIKQRLIKPISLDLIGEFKKSLIDYFKEEKTIMKQIDQEKTLTEELENKAIEKLKEFVHHFLEVSNLNKKD